MRSIASILSSVALFTGLFVTFVAPSYAANGASVNYNGLPSRLYIGQTYWAVVTMRNTGDTTWTAAGGYALGMVGDSDPFAAYADWGRQPVREHVPPGGYATFVFPLIAGLEDSPSGVSDWRMIQNSTWFGSTASRTATVSSPAYEADSGFVLGLHSHSWYRDFLQVAPPAEKPFLKNARIVIPWMACEPTKGQFEWWELDYQIQRLRQEGVCNILVTVAMPVPVWARATWRSMPDRSPPQNLQDWQDFCSALAARYKGKIDYYQILQEPGWDIDAPPSQQGIVYFGGQAETEYLPMLQRAYTAIKAQDPNAMVISGALMSDLSYDYNKDFATYNINLANGLANYCDYIGCHPYYHWSRWGEYIANLRTSLATYGVSASRMMVTEIGCYNYDWKNQNGTQEDQRNGIYRGIASIYNEGVRKIWIYEDINDPPGETWDQDYGLLNHLGVPNLAWYAYKHWQDHLAKNEPVRPLRWLKKSHAFSQVTLSWVNMYDCTAVGTVIRYKKTGYPTGPLDGTLVVNRTHGRYQEQSFTHTGLVNGDTYYYAAYAYNSQGQYSQPLYTSVVTNDVTPPTTPIVDDGVFIDSLDTLHASWFSEDPETGIEEYQYAIGTTSGGTNVVGWTSVGTAVRVTRTGLTLTMGQKYYFSVKARNGMNLWSDVGYSKGVMVANEVTIAEAKGLPTNTRVGLRRVVVTSATDDQSLKITVQEPGRRGGGINVITIGTTGINVMRGDIVDVCGTVSGSSGLRNITSPSVGVISTNNNEPVPLSMGVLSVAGADLNTLELGVNSPVGPNNVGLLVRIMGKVTYSDSSVFYVDDGSGVMDPIYGRTGIRVPCSGTLSAITSPTVGQHVAVTGISRIFVNGSLRARMIQVRKQSDIQVLQ